MRILKTANKWIVVILMCLAVSGCHDSRPIEKEGRLKYEFWVRVDRADSRGFVNSVSRLIERRGLVPVRDSATERAVNQHRSAQVYLLYGVSPREAEDLLVIFVTNTGDAERFVVQLYEGGVPLNVLKALQRDLIEQSKSYKKNGSAIVISEI